MPSRSVRRRAGGLLDLAAADALWTALLAGADVRAAPKAFTGPSAEAAAGYVLLGGQVVPTMQGTGGVWLVPEMDVREAAAELNSVAVDRQDLVRVGPFRSRLPAGTNTGPGLRWRQRLGREQTLLRNAAASGEAGDGGDGLRHLAGIDWRRGLVERPGHGAVEIAWWLPRALVQVLDAAEHAEKRWLRAARTCQRCAAVTDHPAWWRVPADRDGQILCPACRATTLRPYRGELEGHLYSAAAKGLRGAQQASGWLCAVCRQAPASVLDHCHEHGYVRAPVCPSCNSRERPEFLYRNDVLVGSRYETLFGTPAEHWLRHWHRCPGCRTRTTLPLPHLAALTAHLAATKLRPTHREPGSARGRKPCGVLRASWTGSQNAPASCEITVAVDFCPAGEHRILAHISYRDAVDGFRTWLAAMAPRVAAAAGPGRHDSLPAQFRPVVADTSGEGLALF